MNDDSWCMCVWVFGCAIMEFSSSNDSSNKLIETATTLYLERAHRIRRIFYMYALMLLQPTTKSLQRQQRQKGPTTAAAAAAARSHKKKRTAPNTMCIALEIVMFWCVSYVQMLLASKLTEPSPYRGIRMGNDTMASYAARYHLLWALCCLNDFVIFVCLSSALIASFSAVSATYSMYVLIRMYKYYVFFLFVRAVCQRL